MIGISKNGPVTTIELQRPERKNAVNRELAHALTAAVLAFDRDDSASVAVLCGSAGTFCAGADLKAVHDGTFNDLDPEGLAPLGPSRLLLSKPIIAAVNGFAVAGGLELALWCDMRVVEESATFGVFCRRFGVPLIDGGTVRLPRLIGLSRAMDMILTGRAVSASEALSWGLANRVVPDGTARIAAEALALELAALPQICLRNDRLNAHAAFDAELPAALRAEFDRGMVTIESGETASGASAFALGKGRHGTQR